MQLGVRWQAGEPPHRSVPPSLHGAIARREAAHPGARAWTLTWLEGRPRCALDGVALVELDANGAPRVTVFSGPDASPADDAPDQDDWLS